MGLGELQLNTASHHISIDEFLETNGFNYYCTAGFGGDGPINPSIDS